MQNVKQHIALFYVALMLLFKVVGLHALSHHTDDGDVNHCQVCEISTEINLTPLVNTEASYATVDCILFPEEKLTNNTFFVAVSNRFLSSNLHTRPPPPLS